VEEVDEVVSESALDRAISLYRDGATTGEILDATGVSRQRLYRALPKRGLGPDRLKRHPTAQRLAGTDEWEARARRAEDLAMLLARVLLELVNPPTDASNGRGR
jgi:hypothetical protein